MKRTAAFAIAILICTIMTAGSAAAQAVASVSGTVMDSTGAALPNANVTAVNQGTNQSRTVTSDATGHFTILQLPVGTYSLSTTATGFKKAETRDLILEVQQSRTVDFKLEPSSVTTEVNVSSTVAQVEVQRNDATLGQIIHAEQVSELPLNGRNFVQLALLGPGT